MGSDTKSCLEGIGEWELWIMNYELWIREREDHFVRVAGGGGESGAGRNNS